MLTERHHERGCTGCPTRQKGAVQVLDGMPRPIAGAPPAYPDGWLSVSVETDAELGYALTDAIAHDPDAVDPITHCIRLAWSNPPVFSWLRTYTLIRTGAKRPPEWTHPVYEAIMIGIDAVRSGIEYARAMSARKRAQEGARV